MRSRGARRALRLPIRFAGGLLAASGIASLALRARALSSGGALAATLVGSCVFAGVGFRGSAALIAYFSTSTLLGRLPNAATAQQRRGNRRDAIQVLANGGIPATLAFVAGLGKPGARPLAQAGYFGAVASATGDTWATEIGMRLGHNPRSIVTFQPTPPGASGGITLTGLGGSLCGAAMIALLADAKPSPLSPCQRSTAFAIALGGFTGSLADSFLGATAQEVRTCLNCGVETELLVHCGSVATRRTRGAAWCNNDVVNALSTAIGAGATMALVASLHREVGTMRPRRPCVGKAITLPLL